MVELKEIIPNGLYKKLLEIYNNYFNDFKVISYSQEGEDLVLKRYFHQRQSGFYIDIGAHHPKRFSNTYLFYKKGWRGINIEPRPGSKTLFDKYRNRDINLETPISNKESELTYYILTDPALNSFDCDMSNGRHKNTQYKIVDKIRLKTQKLSSILDQYLTQNQIIDLLTVDVEGLDLSVLDSNNWEKYRPEIILCEEENFSFSELSKSKLYKWGMHFLPPLIYPY
jgi:FkbM family methyltransferase